MADRKIICVAPTSLAELVSGLWRALEMVLPVRFTSATDQISPAGWVLAGENGEGQALAADGQSLVYASQPDKGAAQQQSKSVQVTFADLSEVPFPFRGLSLSAGVMGPVCVLSPVKGERVLASTEAGPVWTVVGDGSESRFRCGFTLPAVEPDENLHDVLNGNRFIELIPLLHFLRSLCADQINDGPALRACFMFDDPNLHWPSYGHVDYRQIVAQAERENYHVSFATVPLDGWFTHRTTADLFRQHSDRISLLVHGNNHTHRELAQDLGEFGRKELLGQAIRRVELLETNAGVVVSRVMAAPHGACSGEMLELLPKCGFDAATISHGSLRVHNRGQAWTKRLGYSPAENIRGCPVLPRWRLALDAKNTVLLAAFLKQPIILVGHHGDLKGGTGLMDELARFINGLGHVRWGSMADLVRWSCQWRLQDSGCVIAPLISNSRMTIPSGAERFMLRSPVGQDWSNWQLSVEGEPAISTSINEPIELPGLGGREILVEGDLNRRSENGSTISTRPHLGPLSRRLLTEMRDRLVGLT